MPAHTPPGTVRPARFRPRFHWELLVCGLRGHELIGTDARTLRPEDAVFARALGSVRWYRCVRCDSWLPLPLASRPTREFAPPREQIELPLRGRALRDKIVLRLIAIDRAIHFVVLAALAAAAFLFAAHRLQVRRVFFRIVNAVQGTTAGTHHTANHGFLHAVEHVFALRSTALYELAAAATAYALLEGTEAVGLWFQQRWAEYLTFVATIAFIPYELYELAKTVSPLKILALVVNLAIALYLLYAKRLFGLRGGAPAVERERTQDVGWTALERTAPELPDPADPLCSER
jgi:uncharacterized membrane protein (DUF2068 family)